jgi:hypothetical protein
MLKEVQEDPECSKRSRRIQKCSKFDHLKHSRKGLHCIELGDIFPTVQKSPQMEFV